MRGFQAPRSALYLPASNARAVEKARGLAADLVILDLEDAVKPELKAEARAAATMAAATFGKHVAIRINAADTEWHEADVLAVAASLVDAIVVPKVELPDALAALAARINKPLIPMIESPLGVYNARQIAATQGVAGVFVGNNDLAIALKVPLARAGLITALQLTVLAARAAGVWVLDGVYNALDDAAGFAAECAHGRLMGFDGKTLIHPNQIAPCNAAFSPSDAELDDARALIEAAAEGAQRFRGRMVEAMHVEAARAMLARGADYSVLMMAEKSIPPEPASTNA